ncbi:MAG: hypothetical protein P1P89_22635 [Desulfobacterales bacterium]|nr:hypothetical protein [Desulfobacterales bacterium]
MKKIIWAILFLLLLSVFYGCVTTLDRVITKSATKNQWKLVNDLFYDSSRSGFFVFVTGWAQYNPVIKLSGKYVGGLLSGMFVAAECKPGLHHVELGHLFKLKCINIGPSQKLYIHIKNGFNSEYEIIDRTRAEKLLNSLMFGKEFNNIENTVSRPIPPRCE